MSWITTWTTRAPERRCCARATTFSAAHLGCSVVTVVPAYECACLRVPEREGPRDSVVFRRSTDQLALSRRRSSASAHLPSRQNVICSFSVASQPDGL